MKTVGITGGIACGKSMVAAIIKAQGRPVYSADEMVAFLYTQADVVQDIDQAFGTHDKQTLRDIVFKSPKKRHVLEDILHPHVQTNILDLIQKHQILEASLIFFEIPLLFEAGMETLFDFIVCVSCSEAIQTERLMGRDHISKSEAKSIMQAQWDLDKKEKQSDYVLKNNAGIQDLEKHVLTLLNKIESL